MMKETKEESPLMKKLSKVLADKNDDYYITAADLLLVFITANADYLKLL